jgi:tryptophan halogenase
MPPSIVIVGGGTSGWISAATLLGVPGVEITVIESPKIPTIGVGESTIDGFVDWLNLIGIHPVDIMKETDATFKHAIKFTNFLRESHEFYYPFGVNGIDKEKYDSWATRRFISPESHRDFADTFFANMALIRDKKFKCDSKNFPHNSYALHFDATKFAGILRDRYCKPRGVKHICAEVKEVVKGNDDGIERIITDTGDSYTADIFIDCTGFKSILLEGVMKEPFIDYSNVLPNNMAWATHMPYIDKEKEYEAATNCTALGNGWAWNIPLWSKIGTGYVYSDKFISDDDALAEFKEYIKKQGRDPETLEYKKIKMKNGTHENIWVKNVVAIGLSAGFIEPLESTGLWFSHGIAKNLLQTLYRSTITNQHDRDNFNRQYQNSWKEMISFVSKHYALSLRRDTPYWRNIANMNFEMDERFVFGTYDHHWYSKWSGMNCLAAGMEHYFFDEVHFWAQHYPKNVDWKKHFSGDFTLLDTAYQGWLAEARTAKDIIRVLEEINNTN